MVLQQIIALLDAMNTTRRRNDKVVNYVYLINLFYLQHSYRTKELCVDKLWLTTRLSKVA